MTLHSPARRTRVNIAVLHPQRKNGSVLTTCTQCGGTNSSHASTCFVCDAPLRRYAPADEPENDSAQMEKQFEADLMESMPAPVRKASERASATIAALCNSAPAAAPPAEERKAPPRPRRAETRVYPGPAPDPAESAPRASAPAPASSSSLPTNGTVVAGPHPPRKPRTRIVPDSQPLPAASSSREPTLAASVAVAEPEPAIIPAPAVESAIPVVETVASPPVQSAKVAAPSEPAEKLRAADLSDPESSDKLRITAELLSTAPEPKLGTIPNERIATASELDSLKTAPKPQPKAAAPVLSPEPVKLEPVAAEPQPEKRVAPIRVMPISAPTEPQWRQELSSRVEAYRAKRRNSETGESNGETDDAPQDSLPFSEPAIVTDAALTDADTAPDPRASLRLYARSRPSQTEQIEISAVQPELNFIAAEQARPFAERLVPVAALDDRRTAGLLDAGFLLLSYAGFLTLFGSLGGKFAFGKIDLLVYGVTFFLFYVQYFALFTTFGGVTPGMGMRGLRVVAFDGTPATARQLVWRSFGYVISAATMMLGFLWAMWDEDHLTWHDRMSQTYLTAAPPAHTEAPSAT